MTETEVHRAQRELAGQVEPQVKELIQRAEDGLEDLKRKEKVLRGKVRLLLLLSAAAGWIALIEGRGARATARGWRTRSAVAGCAEDQS